MNLDVPDAPLKEKMLVMKAGNGINPEHVATIVSAMFIEAGHDEFEHKLTLQHGRNSTFYLLGDLPTRRARGTLRARTPARARARAQPLSAAQTASLPAHTAYSTMGTHTPNDAARTPQQ